MKRFSFGFIAVAILVMLVSCGQMGTSSFQSSAQEEESKSITIVPSTIQVSIDATRNTGDSFEISTNLPDDTNLILTLSSTGYSAQDEVQVSGGKATSRYFSNKGARLNGEYTLNVTMPAANLQSEAVKAFIGDNGEYLAGQLVKEFLGSKIVEAEFTFTIAAPVVSTPAAPSAGNGGTKKSALDIIKETAYGNLTRTQKIAIIDWIEDRYDYYDKVEGRYAGDKYTATIFSEAANRYSKTYQQIDAIWGEAFDLKYS